MSDIGCSVSPSVKMRNDIFNKFQLAKLLQLCKKGLSLDNH